MRESNRIVNGHEYSGRCPEEVVQLLERLLAEPRRQTRYRFHWGDSETGRDWMDEWHVDGYLGLSTGDPKLILLCHNARSLGGGAILTGSIVRIRYTGKNGRDLYRHPKYHHKELRIVPSDLPEYAETVLADGQPHARFEKMGQARAWIEKHGWKLTE